MSVNTSKLEGRRVLITGAGSGIGRVLAETAISAGALVTLVDLDGDSIADLGSSPGSTAVAMDVGDPEAWAKIPAPDPAWDYVALNAGIMTAPPGSPRAEYDVLTMDLARYERVMRVNTEGVLHGVRRVTPELAPDGAIVVTASAAGLVGYGLDVAYAMSKSAVISLVRGLAQVLERRAPEQKICAICPGGVKTAIVPAIYADIKDKMMEPSVLADEIVDLWLDGENGEVRAKMRPELPGMHVPDPELPDWW